MLEWHTSKTSSMNSITPPKVLISYSHDSDRHDNKAAGHSSHPTWPPVVSSSNRNEIINLNYIHHQLFKVVFWAVLVSSSAARCVAQAKKQVLSAQPFVELKPVPPTNKVEDQYIKTTQMIPTRDGVRLYTEIYSPREMSEPLPIIFLRTPYRVANENGGFTNHFDSVFRELAKQKYIFAVQDARGRHRSEGKFEWNRPVRHRTNSDAIDASTDAYDSIDWLVKNVEQNNGRVGMLGVSYPGWYVVMALIDPHPALRAASPQASPSDYFIGDDFFHFGAFRLSPSAELPYLFDFDPKENSRFPFDQVDTYEFFLDLGPLSNMNT
jgi:dipeptidyl aminopeptidase/acylaminoacyl peptidase